MRDFSQEEIQNAAEEVRRRDFGDFMFRDPGFNRGTSSSSSHHTSRRNTSRNHVTSRHTSRRHTSRRVTSRRLRCYNTTEGNYLVRRCFEGSNMALFIRRRR